MGLTLVLERQRTKDRETFVSMDDQLKSRILFGLQVSRFYTSYFKAKSIEIWKFAPLEEFDGIRRVSIQIPDGYVTRQDEVKLFEQFQSLEFVDRFLSVVQIQGTWEFDDLKFDAYVSISNDPNWRRIYGDIELNAFPTAEVTDIVELLYKNETMKEQLIDFFLTSFAKVNDGIHRVSGIYFSLGVPSAEDFDLWRTAFVSSETKLLEDAITALKATGGEEIQRSLSPYSVPYLVRSLRQIPEFESTLHAFFSNASIVEKEIGSVGYIGEDPESFKKLFSDLSEKVLLPVIHSLPPESDIASRIRNTIEGQRTLDAHQ